MSDTPESDEEVAEKVAATLRAASESARPKSESFGLGSGLPPASYAAAPSPPMSPPPPPVEVDAEELKRLILVHNEKTKLTATATNTTAVALFGGGFVLPIVGLSFPLSAAPPPGQVTFITMIVWASVAGGLHWWARTMLERLR